MNEYEWVKHKPTAEETRRLWVENKRRLVQHLIDHRKGFSLGAQSPFRDLIPAMDLVHDGDKDFVFSPREKR